MNGSTSTPRRTAAREARAAALRKAERQRLQRRKVAITAAALGVLGVAAVVGVAVQSSRGDTETGAAVPRNVVDGAIAVGSDDASVTVTVYEDFLCPACRVAEESLGGTLTSLSDAGTVRVEYRPMAFLDAASSDRYSTRALSAAGCVVDVAPASFPAFHASLFANQPAEGGPGLTNDRLGELARDAGAGDVSACLDSGRFVGWSRQMTESASVAGVHQTPTFLVEGEVLEQPTPASLAAAVEAVRADG